MYLVLKAESRKQRKSFNLTFRYIDDVLSLNNPKFGDYIDVIYPQELQIQDTTDAGNWANYIDLRLEFDTNGSLTINFMTNVMISIFILSIFHLLIAIFLNMVYLFLS